MGIKVQKKESTSKKSSKVIKVQKKESASKKSSIEIKEKVPKKKSTVKKSSIEIKENVPEKKSSVKKSVMEKKVQKNESAPKKSSKTAGMKISKSLMKKGITSVVDQFNADIKTGKNSVNGLELVFNDAENNEFTKGRLCLDIISHKVPRAKPSNANRPLHPIINRFSIPHSMTDGATSVLLVTRDYPKLGADVNLSNAHYKTMLTNAGCNHLVTEIMSLSQLKAEYMELESRQNLCSRIDVVLCDTCTAKVVPRILGRTFQMAKKYPIGVKLHAKNLKLEITKKLGQTCHKMTFRNTQSSLTFGLSNQSTDELADNLSASIDYLHKKFPGGFKNVKSMYITLGLKARVPLYISKESGNNVEIPKILKPVDEILEGDFGFGNVRITSSGTLLQYTPNSDDEGYEQKKKVKVPGQKKRKRVVEHNDEEYLDEEDKVNEIKKVLKGETVFTTTSTKKTSSAVSQPKKKKKTKARKPKEMLFSTELEEDI